MILRWVRFSHLRRYVQDPASPSKPWIPQDVSRCLSESRPRALGIGVILAGVLILHLHRLVQSGVIIPRAEIEVFRVRPAGGVELPVDEDDLVASRLHLFDCLGWNGSEDLDGAGGGVDAPDEDEPDGVGVAGVERNVVRVRDEG
ncbi:unnamed protein product [Clonostachys byssicola]|uniref:Uncharacterized protein n=1 Tax=Clonostachys byssicola TaxID=160290 RepID=A0A9N9Y7V3_9HYPO|nr:unnamed protein product [Clonostachys byssicola]